MCPYEAIDLALYWNDIWDTISPRRKSDARFRAAAKQLREALETAEMALSAAFRKADKIFASEPDTIMNSDISDPIRDDPWVSASVVHNEIRRLQALAAGAAGERPGNEGDTQFQSVVEGFLVAWDRANGKLPDPGNTSFQLHVEDALRMLYPDYLEKDLPKAIQGARDRIKKRRQKKNLLKSRVIRGDISRDS